MTHSDPQSQEPPKRDDPQRAEPADAAEIEDPVDEASAESFPASDPPAFTPTHVGDPADHEDRRATRKPGTPGTA